MIRLLVFLSFALHAISTQADMDLTTSVDSEGLSERTEIGSLAIEGIGPVRFEAYRVGHKIKVIAFDAEGNAVGAATSVSGPASTSLYLKSANGLQKITVRWTRFSETQIKRP